MHLFRMAYLVGGLALFTLTGCFTDGGNGEKGVVRFSQMVNFLETRDFTSPLAVKRTVLVRLEHADTLVTSQLRQAGWPELTLEVQPVNGGSASVFPLGFAQFGVVPQDEGTFRLVARQDGKEVDSLKLTSAAMGSLRFGASAQVTSSNTSCSRSNSVAVHDLGLATDDRADLVVVPLDKSGRPMLGMLQLTARASSTDVKLDTPMFIEGVVPNTLTVDVAGGGASNVDVIVQEANGLSAKVTLPLTGSASTVGCR